LTHLANRLSRYRVSLGYILSGLLGCLIISGGEDVVLFILSLTIYGFAAWTIFRHAGGFAVTPAILFFLFFTVFTYVGGLALFFSNGEGVSYGGGDRNYIFYLAVHGGILTWALGIIFATIAFGFSPSKELASFRRTPWRNVYNLSGDTVVIALIGLVALIMSALYAYNRGSLPLLKVLLAQGTPDVYELASATRAEFSRYGRGVGSYFYQGYFQQFYLVILPFVTLYVGARSLYYRKVALRVLWVVLGIVTAFFLSVSLQRWPLMFFIVMNYILYANYKGRIRISHALSFIILALALFAFLTYLRGITDLALLVGWVVDRIFAINVDVLYSMFEMFPEHFPFFGGLAILGDLKGVLPGPDTGFTRWLFDALFRVYSNGTAPTIFWGELYADFGLPGVWVGSLLAGFTIQGVYIYYLRGQKDLLRLVVYTIVTIAIGALAMTNITDVIFQFGIVTALLLVLTLNLSRWIFEPWPMLRFRERAVR